MAKRFSSSFEDSEGNKGHLTLDEINNKVEKIEEQMSVTVHNGEPRTMTVATAIKEIWEDLEFIRDVNDMWRIIKKYKKTSIFILIIGGAFIFGLPLKDLIIKWLSL